MGAPKGGTGTTGSGGKLDQLFKAGAAYEKKTGATMAQRLGNQSSADRWKLAPRVGGGMPSGKGAKGLTETATPAVVPKPIAYENVDGAKPWALK